MKTSLKYVKVPIYGHGERSCPVCTQCLRTFHPDALKTGSRIEDPDRGEAWLCSFPCTYAWRRGISRTHERISSVVLDESVLDKYKSIPGASWADDESE